MYKILAVDDEETNLNLVEYALNGKYEVISVKSGAMALKYLSVNKPDLILLDIWMPEINGLEVYEKINDNPKLKDVPVIFLTSATDAKTEEKCFDMGAFDFISKPFTPSVVLRRIDRTLKMVNRLANVTKPSIPVHMESNMTEADGIVEVNANGLTTKLYQKDISYIEVFNNTCLIHTNTREISIRETLERMQEKLGDSFIRTGRSYLINIHCISEILDDVIVMANGMKIKMPRRNKKEISAEIMMRLNDH